MRIINVTPKMDALLLGKQGENKSTKFLFDVSGWLEDYPGCTITLVHRRPHESSSYPCVLTTEEDGRRSWVINSADLAKDGDGQAELKCTLGDVIEKDKRTWKTKIGKSLSGDGDAPEQWESLMDDIEALVGDAQDAAEDAEDAETAAAASATDAATSATAAAGSATAAAASAAEAASKADKNNPVFTGYISMGRTGSYGDGSVAEGIDVNAQGDGAQAYGKGTIARGDYSQVFGMYNIPDSYESLPEWQPNTHYYVGDKVKRGIVMPPLPARWWMCICKEENEDSSYTPSKWEQHSDGFMRFAEIVGNGVSDNDRSNARRLDWDGNEELAGDLTINKGKANEVSVTELKTQINSKYEKPNTGIPASDMAEGVQNSLNNADSAYQKPQTGIPLSDLADNTESVTGTTPSITGVSGHRYICGECATLSITAPASGCIDILFESGSTPTVLTITSAKTGVTDIKWMDGFDPDDLDANTIYEINILDGEFGVVAEWT